MENIAISVVMPSLNVEPYIRECMESVLRQTQNDIEIICVDAGSTDGTLEILEKYALKDSRIRIIQSDKKSYGYQVNCGISDAKGKYIAILETDDYIDLNMYKTLYDFAEQTGCDYVKANFQTYFTLNSGARVYQKIGVLDGLGYEYDHILNVQDCSDLHLRDVNVWNGIYDREFLIEKKIRFNETKGAAFQDIGFLQQIFWKADTALYTEQALYNYCIDREDSSTNKGNGLEFAYQEYQRLLEEKLEGVSEERIISLYERMTDVFWENLKKTLLLNKERESAEIIKWFLQILLEKEKKGIIHRYYLEAIIAEGITWIRDYKRQLISAKKEKENCLNRLIDQSIIIFGAGIRGKDAFRTLDNAHIEVKGFCDNNSSLWGKKIGDVFVYCPEEAILHYPDFKFVIANRLHFQEIEHQLGKAGVTTECVLVWP